MILFIECVVACLLFTIIFVGLTILKKEAFLTEYAPAVRQRFLELHPEYVVKDPNKMSVGYIISKILMSIFFIIVLAVLVYIAGAKDFLTGALYSYIIWFVVNWYDVFALDMGIFVYCKKVRLPGTLDMDEEYKSNAKKHIKDGFIGVLIGIPISLIVGLLILVINMI